MRAILVYALLRAALFVAPFAILVAAQVEWYVALVIALLFAFAASYVFLRRFKESAVAEIARMRGERGERADEDAEDEALDGERATDDRDAAASDDSLADANAVDGTTSTTQVDPDVVTDAQADADASRDRDDR
ncbi:MULTISPECIES: DUF4229 domain-containing protein [unclassified Agrococcus]|uniref:DUF4229 domain-containing protein n=1 Tax=unclassified Agrococcus TaxID=2615065 RepID=UPI003615BF89